MSSTADSSGAAAVDADLRAGHRPRPRLGEGAEQAPARPAVAARRRPEPRRHGQQVDPQLPADRRPHLRRRQHRRRTTSTTTSSRRSRPSLAPRAGRRRGRGLRHRLLRCASGSTPTSSRKYGMTSDDVVAAVRTYNVEVSAGQLGGAPARAGPAPQRLDPRPVAAGDAGGVRGHPAPDERRRLGRARVATSAGPSSAPSCPTSWASYNGQPAAMLAIRQEAGANALDTADRDQGQDGRAVEVLPGGHEGHLPDGHDAVRAGGDRRGRQDAHRGDRPRLPRHVPLPREPAGDADPDDRRAGRASSGTFGVLGAFGYSINMLTMFAMVLAIGLLVDDAIVVVENVERVMSEEGLPPWEATRKSMDEITSALVGIGLVLSAVFGPMIFFPGSTGVIYRQFSVTVIASMLLSVVVALILTPVLCASLLQAGREGARGGRDRLPAAPPVLPLVRPRLLPRRATATRGPSAHILARKARYGVVFVVIVAVLVVLFVRMPTGYLPDEDQGIADGDGASCPSARRSSRREAVHRPRCRATSRTTRRRRCESFMGDRGHRARRPRPEPGAWPTSSCKDWDLRGSAGPARARPSPAGR